jgi:hypothetical protein
VTHTRLALALCALLAAACGRRESPRLHEPAPTTSLPNEPAAAQPPRTLIVGGDGGLDEMRYDGTVVRTLSRTPARRPRRVDGGREVLFWARERGELRRVTLADGAEKAVATLPRAFTMCEGSRRRTVPLAELAVQDDHDFVVDSAANAACMTLMDRNANMANVAIDLQIDLRTGRVRHRTTVGGACPREPASLPPCDHDVAPSRSHPRFPLGTLGIPAKATEESISPSGHWSLVALPREEGD